MMHVIMQPSPIRVLFIYSLTLCGCDLSPGNTLLTIYEHYTAQLLLLFFFLPKSDLCDAGHLW